MSLFVYLSGSVSDQFWYSFLDRFLDRFGTPKIILKWDQDLNLSFKKGISRDVPPGRPPHGGAKMDPKWDLDLAQKGPAPKCDDYPKRNQNHYLVPGKYDYFYVFQHAPTSPKIGSKRCSKENLKLHVPGFQKKNRCVSCGTRIL